ncbi:MAG: outer membrane beta-barrel protein [Bacteroidales bacterium]|nr:outer membrane beta-barrel protein [Bacteroidales bacterium]
MKRLTLILFAVAAALTVHAQDADSLKIDPVSLGVLVQANYAGESMYIAESALYAYPGVGAEIGAFIDYNITRRLQIEFQVIMALQNGSYVVAKQDPGFFVWHRYKEIDYLADLRLWGLDLPFFVVGRFPSGNGNFRLGAGPFTHLTLGSWCPGDSGFITPYKRVISEDDVTGKKRYALNDSHAGFGLLFGYEFESGLQINFSGKYSIIDIINYDSEYSHAHPYKISLGVGWRF